MLSVLSRLAELHDVRFVLAAALICALTASAALWLHLQDRPGRSLPIRLWMTCRGLALGSGFWAANVILLLGYAPFSPAGVTPSALAASFAIASLWCIAGLSAARALTRRSKRRAAEVQSGLIMGAGLLVIHYAVLCSVSWRGGLHWRLDAQLAAAATALVTSVASRLAGGNTPGLRRGLAATLLATCALVGLHLVSVAGLGPSQASAPAIFDNLALRAVLAAFAAGLSLLLVIMAGAMALFEARAQEQGLQHLRTATNAMPAALAFFDPNGRLLAWNTTFEQIIGPNAAVTAGMSIQDMNALVAPPGAPLRSGDAWRNRMTMEFPHPNGQWIRVENVPTDDGGLLSVGIDITEIKRSEAALAQALDRAESANRAKSEFLANMSHEIRTPLNGVSGLADVLARTRLSREQRELVEIIRSSAQTVDQLLGDILDLSSMEAGQTQVGRAPFALGELVRQAAARHRPRAEAKGLVLLDEVAPEAEGVVLGDAVRLSKVLNNLLSNAVKFTESGEIRVGVRPLDQDRFRLEVKDTGVGFDTADRARLFDRFAQGDGSATRKFSGAGLGLTLVSQCAKLMDATLDCVSAPGQGALFTFDLSLPRSAEPARAEPEPVRAEAPQAGDAAERAPLKVLVVDDNATNRRVLELILSQLGAEACPVENGQEAVEAFERGRFDVILMDIQMPVMDGLTATRAIRALERSQGRSATPVIIVSANCMPEHVQAGLEAGAQEHLGKPINAQALVDAISNALVLKQQSAA